GTYVPAATDTRQRSPRKIEPPSGFSRPPMQRSVVVLHQPLGPSSVKNSPSAISRLRSATARVPVNPFCRPSTLSITHPSPEHLATLSSFGTCVNDDELRVTYRPVSGKFPAHRSVGAGSPGRSPGAASSSPLRCQPLVDRDAQAQPLRRAVTNDDHLL